MPLRGRLEINIKSKPRFTRSAVLIRGIDMEEENRYLKSKLLLSQKEDQTTAFLPACLAS